MNESIQTGILIVVLLAVAGFIGYKIYLNYKNTDPGEFNVFGVVTFVLSNIEYFVDALQDAMADINGIDADSYENDEEYHQKLIDTAITIIEERAKEVGITFKMNHDTLVNLADIAIHQIIKFIEQSEREKALVDSMKAIEADVPVKEEQKDISRDIEDFYQ